MSLKLRRRPCAARVHGQNDPAIFTFEAKAKGAGSLGPVAVQDGIIGGIGFRRV